MVRIKMKKLTSCTELRSSSQSLLTGYHKVVRDRMSCNVLSRPSTKPLTGASK